MSNRLFSNILNAWKGVSMQFNGKRLELSPYLHSDELEPLKVKISACLKPILASTTKVGTNS